MPLGMGRRTVRFILPSGTVPQTWLKVLAEQAWRVRSARRAAHLSASSTHALRARRGDGRTLGGARSGGGGLGRTDSVVPTVTAVSAVLWSAARARDGGRGMTLRGARGESGAAESKSGGKGAYARVRACIGRRGEGGDGVPAREGEGREGHQFMGMPASRKPAEVVDTTSAESRALDSSE